MIWSSCKIVIRNLIQEKASKIHPGSSAMSWASLTDAEQTLHSLARSGTRSEQPLASPSTPRNGQEKCQGGAEPEHLRALGFTVTCGIPNPSPATLMFACIIVFQPLTDFILFIKQAQKYCWKFYSLPRLLMLPVCCQGFYMDQGRHPIIGNFLLRCSRMSISA